MSDDVRQELPTLENPSLFIHENIYLKEIKTLWRWVILGIATMICLPLGDRISSEWIKLSLTPKSNVCVAESTWFENCVLTSRATELDLFDKRKEEKKKDGNVKTNKEPASDAGKNPYFFDQYQLTYFETCAIALCFLVLLSLVWILRRTTNRNLANLETDVINDYFSFLSVHSNSIPELRDETFKSLSTATKSILEKIDLRIKKQNNLRDKTKEIIEASENLPEDNFLDTAKHWFVSTYITPRRKMKLRIIDTTISQLQKQSEKIEKSDALDHNQPLAISKLRELINLDKKDFNTGNPLNNAIEAYHRALKTVLWERNSSELEFREFQRLIQLESHLKDFGTTAQRYALTLPTYSTEGSLYANGGEIRSKARFSTVILISAWCISSLFFLLSQTSPPTDKPTMLDMGRMIASNTKAISDNVDGLSTSFGKSALGVVEAQSETTKTIRSSIEHSNLNTILITEHLSALNSSTSINKKIKLRVPVATYQIGSFEFKNPAKTDELIRTIVRRFQSCDDTEIFVESFADTNCAIDDKNRCNKINTEIKDKRSLKILSRISTLLPEKYSKIGIVDQYQSPLAMLADPSVLNTDQSILTTVDALNRRSDLVINTTRDCSISR